MSVRSQPASVHRRGFSMMEVTLSVVLVGGVLVAALSTVASAKSARALMTQREIGGALCESMLGEVLAQSYEDPAEAKGSFGRSAGEVGDGSRALFDDVDDYDGWSASPPQEKDGSPISWAGSYTRDVSVQTVRAADLADTAPDGVSLKRVTVTVSLGAKPVYTMQAYVSPLWPDPREAP